MKTKTNKAVFLASIILGAMSLPELRGVAKELKVPCGKSGKQTQANLLEALANGKGQVKVMGYIYGPAPSALSQEIQAKFKSEINSNPPTSALRGKLVFVKKLRTYKADKTEYAPAPAAKPVSAKIKGEPVQV
jgi:hypothetical protein